jgi:hypothetical protein
MTSSTGSPTTGQVADEHGFAVMGGAADAMAERLRRSTGRRSDLARRCAWRWRRWDMATGPDRVIEREDLEVAVPGSHPDPAAQVRTDPAGLDCNSLGERTAPAESVADPGRDPPDRGRLSASDRWSPRHRTADLGWPRGPADLRHRDRVRRDLHVPGDSAGSARTRSPATCSASGQPGAQFSNVFLRNGARLYLDVGSHPEYATAGVRRHRSSWSPTTRPVSGSWRAADRRRAAPARRGHRRRHLPVQEQHRLGRQLLRLPRELPGQAGRGSSPGSPRCSSRSW